MSENDDANRLFKMAVKDLKAAQEMLDPQKFADEIFGFHAQQASEKCMKAWLVAAGVAYPRSHDLSLLISALNQAGKDTTKFIDLVELNPFAVQFRYEAYDDFSFDPINREEILRHLNELAALIGSELKLNHEN